MKGCEIKNDVLKTELQKKEVLLGEKSPRESRSLTNAAASTSAPRTAPKKAKSGQRKSADAADSILNWYLTEIHKIPMLTREQEVDTAVLAQDGDQAARDLLVQSNLRFVVTVARKYQSHGLSLMDLINEGNMGLIKASERFNPERGYHFISYAVWWIKQSILFAIQQKSHLIRLPLNRTADLRRLEEAERLLDNQSDGANSLEALASAANMRTDEINHLLRMSRDHLSLDAPMGGSGEDFSLGDNIEDTGAVLPEEMAENAALKDDIKNSMSSLTEREKNVINMRFGLGGGPVLSLQRIGKKIGLSKERIRQIEKKAIRKIRTGEVGQHLTSYLV